MLFSLVKRHRTSWFRARSLGQQHIPTRRQTDVPNVGIGGTLQCMSASLSKRLKKCLHLKTDPSKLRSGSGEIAFLT
jgi:hypothetical protein